jgi:hypothetical protein
MGKDIAAQKHCLRYDDGGERLAASFDKTARVFADRVTLRANESDDSTIYVGFSDVRWLANALIELANVLELPAIAQTQEDGHNDR